MAEPLVVAVPPGSELATALAFEASGLRPTSGSWLKRGDRHFLEWFQAIFNGFGPVTNLFWLKIQLMDLQKWPFPRGVPI